MLLYKIYIRNIKYSIEKKEMYQYRREVTIYNSLLICEINNYKYHVILFHAENIISYKNYVKYIIAILSINLELRFILKNTNCTVL